MTDYEIHTYAAKLPWDGIGARNLDSLRKKLIASGYPDKYPDKEFFVWNGNRALGALKKNVKGRGFERYLWYSTSSKKLSTINPKTGKLIRGI